LRSQPLAPALSVIVVTFNSEGAVSASLPALIEQLGADDELIVVDNASADGTADAVARLAPAATVVRNTRNEGFARACNSGAELATGDLLLFLNPDAVAAPDFCQAIRRPMLGDDRGWAAWMGLVTMAGGRAVNTSGGVIHFTGIAWAGDAGRPLSEAPRSPREVPFLSGACLAVPRETWLSHGGFPPEFFMYCEDVDLSLRLRLAGGRLGLEPAARVEHNYEFSKGPAKWRLLERNRWATIIRTYPAALLGLLLPALMATEAALFAVSLFGGWGLQKALATLDTFRSLPRLLSERRSIQSGRRIGAAQFASHLTPDLSSAYLGRAARVTALRRLLRAYWRLVRLALRVASTSR
jgi:N-acetylglucosaminyl-diphospho-decaprenol L-rhamnosyltransferase